MLHPHSYSKSNRGLVDGPYHYYQSLCKRKVYTMNQIARRTQTFPEILNPNLKPSHSPPPSPSSASCPRH